MTQWQPTATIETIQRRAQLLADVRRFFYARKVLEVETPVLSFSAPTAPYLDSFETQYQPLGGRAQTTYLHTSPEFAMKRLLAAGSGDIYQICKVFRNGEQGRLHSPEFTMLEWYRPQLDYWQLMQEVADLLEQVGALAPSIQMSYQQVFEQFLQINPHQQTEQELAQLAKHTLSGIANDWSFAIDDWLEVLMSQYIEPKLAVLGQPVIVYDFPASQSQLAKMRVDASGQTVAARFEVYAGGLELANGYDECNDVDELRKRFENDNQQRQANNKPLMPIDNQLLAATYSGMPECTGVALGLDRLMMLMIKAQQIEDVQSFVLI